MDERTRAELLEGVLIEGLAALLTGLAILLTVLEDLVDRWLDPEKEPIDRWPPTAGN